MVEDERDRKDKTYPSVTTQEKVTIKCLSVSHTYSSYIPKVAKQLFSLFLDLNKWDCMVGPKVPWMGLQDGEIKVGATRVTLGR